MTWCQAIDQMGELEASSFGSTSSPHAGVQEDRHLPSQLAYLIAGIPSQANLHPRLPRVHLFTNWHHLETLNACKEKENLMFVG